MNKTCSNCGGESNRFKYYIIDRKVVEFCTNCLNTKTNIKNSDNVGLLHNSGDNKHCPKMTMVERRHLEGRRIENINGKSVVTYPRQFRTNYHK